jgi:diguanylate cyclase (GGDEF)-like protein
MSLLKIVNEKNLTIAREQNPLTKLPGNTLIYEFISTAIADETHPYFFVYFDFNNFKSYNDKYGFRHGDRLILRFSELLKSANTSANRFVGHIGGDDFFLGIRGGAIDDVLVSTKQVAHQFKYDAESFYDPDARKHGYIVSTGRNGQEMQTPLITVSCVILQLPKFIGRTTTAENIGNIIAELKKEAKSSPDGFCISSISNMDRAPLIHSVGMG